MKKTVKSIEKKLRADCLRLIEETKKLTSELRKQRLSQAKRK